MEHQVQMRIVLNVDVLLRGTKTEDEATEKAAVDIGALIESLTGKPCSEFGKPSIVDQVFNVAEIETTGCYGASDQLERPYVVYIKDADRDRGQEPDFLGTIEATDMQSLVEGIKEILTNLNINYTDPDIEGDGFEICARFGGMLWLDTPNDTLSICIKEE